MSKQVLDSFEDAFHSQCVDIFVRADGTFGFEEFRREVDGSGSWQSLGRYSLLSFASGAQALEEAQVSVAWLEKLGPWRW